MKLNILLSSITIILIFVFLHNKKTQNFVNFPSKYPLETDYPFNYPTGLFIPSNEKDFRLGITSSVSSSRKYIPTDLRCHPVIDCPQEITRNGKKIIIPPYREKCLGKNICNDKTPIDPSFGSMTKNTPQKSKYTCFLKDSDIENKN